MKRMLLSLALAVVGMSMCGSANATRVSASTATVTLSDGYAVLPSTLPFMNCDPVSYSSVTLTGREILVFYNSGAANATITVTSVVLNHRSGDLTKTISPGSYWITQQFPLSGWEQTDGNLYFQADNAAVKVAVIRLP
jgi:hypothetical protein